jgi:hypothetical protein
MKTFYIRMKSLTNLAREVQELKAVDAHRAFLAGDVAAKNWGIANGSGSVKWWVEDFSGHPIGIGEWVRPEAKADG